ncbi:MAG: DUF4302 domain-containing protein [Prevotella sp.]|nr:DUF4302 domain-containing protein [Prevotella sp.]
MNSKHIIHTAMAAAATAALTTACTFEQEDYFDESASLRVAHINDDIQKRLVEQSDTAQGRHGWVIQYFVAGTDDHSFEGFNLFGRFADNGNVTLASNHRYLRDGNANKYTEHTSTYQLLNEEGPVLSFNTWNNILTVFEDPVDPTSAPRTLVQDGEGMCGDHNLVLRSIADDEILFRGERHSAAVRFIPCDMPWQDYIAQTTAMKDYICNNDISAHYVINGSDTLYFLNLRRGYFTMAERVIDPLQPRSEQCVFTPQGFRMQNNDTIAGRVFQEFRLAADSTCLVSEDGTTQVMAMWDSYLAELDDVWQLDTARFTQQQRELFQAIDQEIRLFNTKWSLKSIGIGDTGDFRGLVFTFNTGVAKKPTNTTALELSFARTAYGRLSVSCSDDPEIDANMENALDRGAEDIVNLSRQFAATICGTFDVKPDSYFRPAKAEFIPADGGTPFSIAQ